VRTLVQMHGGTVHAESGGVGQGARFTVRLPLCEVQSEDGSAPARVRAPPAHGGRILLVDDNADASDMLRLLLEAQGYEVHCVLDGPSALAATKQFIPDLALLDIGLPGMDGYELAVRLRADPRLAGMRLVALTGYGREPDRARAIAMRFDEHLVKPVGADQLLAALAKLLPPHEGGAYEADAGAGARA